MIQSSAALILTGIACFGLSVYMLYVAMPKEGKAAHFWIRTEARTMTLTLVIIAALVMGIGFILKGILS